MIKVQGLGRRRSGMSHEDCIAHHRDFHSKLGLGQADHMAKYVLYYFDASFDPEGKVLPEMEWDMSALDWFKQDEYWDNFQQWLEKAPDGQEVKEDEASFLERERCFLCPYEEKVIVENRADGEVHNVLRLLRYRQGVSRDSILDAQRSAAAAAIKEHFGPSLRKMVSNVVTYGTCLASGRIPAPPVDVTEIYKIDRAAFADPGALVRAFRAPAIAAAELPLFDAGATMTMFAEERIFIA